ncbi:hypothetical protein AB4510_02015 [Vibrio sp. 10N.222.54.B12]|uniref:hypothetical protein n=1 Tax=unclassified Vibrio TaxID=2614977 RepID=UPI00354FA243
MSHNYPWFPTPALPESLTIQNVTPPFGGIRSKGDKKLNTFSDKTLFELLERLKLQGELRDIEWMIVFTRDDEFKAMLANELLHATKLIWMHLIKSSRLLNRTLSRLMQGQDRGYLSIASSLVDSMPSNVSQIGSIKDKQRFAWVKAVITDDYLTCARICMNRGCSIHEFVELLGFSVKGEYLNKVVNLAANVLPASPDEKQLKWWLACQKKMSRDMTLEQLEVLLAKTTYVESGTKFDKWLNEHCLPESDNSLWFSLSQESQQKLKSFYNVIEYSAVKDLFKKLCETRLDPNLNEREVNHLEKRTSFWGGYSDSFVRVRFLLTNRSMRLLNKRHDISKYRVTVMQENSFNELSEICIFETKNHFLIERFRGSFFDLGVFNKTRELEKILFEKENLDGNIISQLKPNWVHDHLNHWQTRLIKFLHPFGINQNQGFKRWNYDLDSDEQQTVNSMLQRRYQNVPDKRIYFSKGNLR